MIKDFCVKNIWNAVRKLVLMNGAFLLLAIPVKSQISEPPKLFVGIVVDQMREDFLLRFYDQFSEEGFKRLVNEGVLCRNVHFNYTPTITAVGHTSIYAGTTPRYHGIIGNSWYQRSTNSVIYCVTDSSEKVIGNKKPSIGSSPRNLLSTNLADELKIATNKKARIYSISTKDRAAILPAGHMADGAFWLDLNTGNYVSSTFYMDELPDWLVQFNKQKLAFKYIEQDWELLLPIESYKRCLPDDNHYETILNGKERPTFPYKLKELAPLNDPYFEVLNRSPLSNTLLADLAVHILERTNIGKGEFTDMLAISFSATDPIGHTYGPLSVEANDAYLRLDLEIARLLKALDNHIGQGNYTLFLTADHGVGEVPQYLADNNVPAGIFSESKLMAGAREYLNDEYGKADWIVAIRNDQVYLNRKLIEQRDFTLSEIQDKLAYYINQQEGVAETYTATQLMKQEYQEYFASKIQKGFNFKLSGDVRYILEPGWYTDLYSCATHNSAYNYDSHVPVFFYGKGVEQGVSYEHHHITDIAPTVSTLLNIKFPSAATGKVMVEVLKK